MGVYLFACLILYHSILMTLNLCDALSSRNYLQLRETLIRDEQILSFGANLKLRSDEITANNCLMAAKFKEVDEGFVHPASFLPSHDFLKVRNRIEHSEVFQLIHQMPKGAVLHVHSTSIASLDFIVRNLTYLPQLHVCLDGGELQFRFLKDTGMMDCNWKLLSDLRAGDETGNSPIDQLIRKRFILLNESEGEQDIDTVWRKFESIFKVIEGLIMYRPVFEKYFYQAMQELYDDHVMYMEFRTIFLNLYEINGDTYDPVNVARIYKEVIDRFTRDHPGFIGAKAIYSPDRNTTPDNFDGYVRTYRQLKRVFPDFLIGFDLVGQEDKGNTLLNFADRLQELGKETQFFFHAGESNWYGHSTDENLYDAILLNTKRIGHGFALLKHPKLMELVRKKNIAIELNPISNQVLKLVKDMRNHPAAYFFAENFPLVVSNDDPSFWGAKGLSYDFYESFVGIMSRQADLRALKQLAINSIIYSSLNVEEQRNAFAIWGREWKKYVGLLSRDCKRAREGNFNFK